MNLGINRNK